MNNFTTTQEDFSFNNTTEIPFEEDYEKIKNNPYIIFEKYKYKLKKVVGNIAYWKNYNVDDLMQQCYIHFLELCELYDPYYQGNFMKFDRYMFRNVMIRLRAYIQKHYKTNTREKPSELGDYNVGGYSRELDNIENREVLNQIYQYIGKKQQLILEYYAQGYKQQEIADMLNINQSKISTIKSQTLTMLQEIVKNKTKKDFR